MWDVKDHLGEISRQIMLSNMIEMLKLKSYVDVKTFADFNTEIGKFRQRCIDCKHLDNSTPGSSVCEYHNLYIDDLSGTDGKIFESLNCREWEAKA